LGCQSRFGVILDTTTYSTYVTYLPLLRAHLFGPPLESFTHATQARPPHAQEWTTPSTPSAGVRYHRYHHLNASKRAHRKILVMHALPPRPLKNFAPLPCPITLASLPYIYRRIWVTSSAITTQVLHLGFFREQSDVSSSSHSLIVSFQIVDRFVLRSQSRQDPPRHGRTARSSTCPQT
jgi:hypothetical protein